MSKCSHCGEDKNICRHQANLTICQVSCLRAENKALKEKLDRWEKKLRDSGLIRDKQTK